MVSNRDWSTSFSPSERALSAVSSTTVSWHNPPMWTLESSRDSFVLRSSSSWQLIDSIEASLKEREWAYIGPWPCLGSPWLRRWSGACVPQVPRYPAKKENLSNTASTIGLLANDRKTRVLRKKVSTNNAVTKREAAGGLEGTRLHGREGDDRWQLKPGDERKVINGNQAFAIFKSIWRSAGLSIQIKIRIFKETSSVSFCLPQNAWRPPLPLNTSLKFSRPSPFGASSRPSIQTPSLMMTRATAHY